MVGFSIIIVTWNALHHLKRFLPSVAATDFPQFEIILADNASTDGSAEWVAENYPDVRVVTFDKNYGYCGGNNRAVPHATFNTLIFLNNDVEVSSDWLQPISKLLAGNPVIDAVQPKLRSLAEPEKFEYAGAAGGLLDKLGYPFCRGRIFDATERDDNQYSRATPIFWASGAALVIKKNIFQEMGGFEESFEFHMEEIDLCWRLQLRGRQVWYCPDSVVYHLGGGSLESDNPRKIYYNFRNNLLMLVRNHPSKGLLRVIFMRLFLDKVAAFRLLLQGKPTHTLAIFRAIMAFFKQLPAARVHRKQAGVNRHLQVPLCNFSIIWQYFVRKKKYYHELPGKDYIHT